MLAARLLDLQRPEVASFCRRWKVRDLKTQAAVLHELLVLGEAAKRLSGTFRDSHPVPALIRRVEASAPRRDA